MRMESLVGYMRMILPKKKPLGSLVMWYNVGQTLFSSDRVGKSEGNERQP